MEHGIDYEKHRFGPRNVFTCETSPAPPHFDCHSCCLPQILSKIVEVFSIAATAAQKKWIFKRNTIRLKKKTINGRLAQNIIEPHGGFSIAMFDYQRAGIFLIT